MQTLLRRLIPLTLSLAFTTGRAGAQAGSDYRVQVFTTDQGLPSQAISDIVETTDSYLWIAAGGILARFDGHQFRSYSQANTAALARRVVHLHAGLGDTLWVVDEGSAVFSVARGRIVQVLAPSVLSLSTVVQDGTGTLFGIGTSRVWKLRSGSSPVEVEPRIVLDPWRYNLPIRDESGRAWIVDSVGVPRVIARPSAPRPPYPLTDQWALVKSRTTGEVLTVRARGELRDLVSANGDVVATYRADSTRSAAIVDAERRTWTVSGASYDVYERGRVEPVARVVTPNPGTLGLIVESTSGCVWIAEVSLIRVCRMPFRTFDFGLNGRLILERGPGASAVSWDAAQRVIVLDGRGGHSLLGNARAELRWARAFVDRRGTTWWSPSMPNGTERRAPDGIRVLPHANAYYFSQPPGDSLLWYAVDRVIYRATLPANGPARVTDSLDVGGGVTSMSHGHDGSLWVTVNTVSLRPELLHVTNGQMRALSSSEGFPTTALRAVLADDDGTVWLGTYGGGLVRYRDGRFRAVTEGDGLAEDVVTSLLEDSAGNLWMGGNRSVHRVSRRDLQDLLDGKARRVNGVAYGRADGLNAPETVGFNGIRDASGRLWFPTIAGPVVVDPTLALSLDSTPPRIHILGIRTDRDTTESIDAAVRLTRGARRVAVEYTGISTRNPDRVRYEYRVDGIDDAWVEAGAARTATYNSIGPGTHTFRVRAINAGGVPSVEDASMQFTVPAYFYETKAFIALMVFATGLLGVAAVRYRERHMRRRELALSQAVKERTVDLATALDTLEKQADQLRTLDEAKSRFFANVSHEFRTPLSLIIGPVEDLRDGRSGELTAAVRHRLDAVQNNARRLLQLVEQLLDVARLESGTIHLSAEVRDLVPLVRRLADSFASLAERRGITFSLTCPVGGLRVRYDPDQMEKVISNLLSNALKFTPPAGTVDLRATQESEGRSQAVIEVQDSGPGIAPEHQSRIFERFFQVDDSSRRKYEGAGIGLALVRELVELHGGTVSLRSALGSGSTFVVRLPLVVGATPHSGEHRTQVAAVKPPVTRQVAPPPVSPRPAPSPDVTTVLVVEDNVELLEFLRERLAEQYRVLLAENGLRGLEMAREHVPDLIISDVMMPEMDGQSLCEAVKSDEDIDFIPVILLTAKASRDSRLAGLAGGADDYLTKPVDFSELLIRAENLINSRRRVRERWRAADHQLPSISVPVKAPPRDASERALLAALGTVLADHLGDENFNVERIATAMGMARSTLYRRLEPLLGMSPLDALQDYRLAQAAQWLAETSITVSEVAYGVGFKSVPHFCRKFREKYSEPPSAYRRSHVAAERTRDELNTPFGTPS